MELIKADFIPIYASIQREMTLSPFGNPWGGKRDGQNKIGMINSRMRMDEENKDGNTSTRTDLKGSMVITGRSDSGIIPQRFLLKTPIIPRSGEKRTYETPNDYTMELKAMEGSVAEFSAHFPEHRQHRSKKMSSGEVVLLTGSTGSLGCHLLAYLVSSQDVFHVFALNRRLEDGCMSLRERQKKAFAVHGLDISLIDSPKVTLIEGDTSTEKLDVDPMFYSLIRDNVTLIIHCAWKPNFGFDFAEFQQNIRGVRNLINLALGSPSPDPPRFIFTSSISVFANWNAEKGKPLETPNEDLRLALGSGYGQSKLVAERILENAASSTPFRPIIVRIGQLAGAANGAWNANNWPPLIALLGQTMGMLPARDDCIAWLSLETAAKAILDFRHSEARYLHLAHPKPVPWNSVFGVFASCLNVPLVDWNTWVSELEGSAAGARLLGIFGNLRGCHQPIALDNREAPGLPLMDMRQALRLSPSLAHPALPQIGREDAGRWVQYWRSVGFLSGFSARL